MTVQALPPQPRHSNTLSTDSFRYSTYPLTLHTRAGRLQAKYTHPHTNAPQNATNNVPQRRERTLGKKNDTCINDAIQQEDPRDHDGYVTRLYCSPAQTAERHSPRRVVTRKTERAYAQQARLQDLRTEGRRQESPVSQNGRQESRAADAAENDAAKKDRPKPPRHQTDPRRTLVTPEEKCLIGTGPTGTST